MKHIQIFAFIYIIFNLNTAYAHWDAHRPDAHAPISIMGDHTHSKGDWMVSTRYMGMTMNTLMKGHDTITESNALADYMMIPTSMESQMLMIGAMHAPSDTITLMVGIPYISKSMGMKNRMGMLSNARSQGFGDLKASGLITLYKKKGHQVHASIGASLPTGKIDQTNAEGKIMGYGMQLGAGSIGVLPGITYLGQTQGLSWGAQLKGAFPLGSNERGYRLGNASEANVWAGAIVHPSLSIGAHIQSKWNNAIQGKDADLNAAMSPGNDPSLHASSQTNMGLGINYLGRHGGLKGHRIAIEWLTPINQYKKGVHLKKDSMIVAGWQHSF
ncbi:MAG: transporter [Candidatus Margulisbacteria bacterium]|nr:transporter [Candidatus Margulisiibacteriota bacterium]